MIDGGLRNLFRKNLPMVHIQPIEIGATGQGVPDANFCYKGIEGFCEFKKAKNNQIGLRSEQIGWIKERLRYGGLVKIAVRLETTEKDYLLMFRGSLVTDLKSQIIQENFHKCINFWEGGPKRWNWTQILGALILRE